jgi:predicted 3-demethylubiquinone-9 3-methyltransferase (glyoxalase superfamily)
MVKFVPTGSGSSSMAAAYNTKPMEPIATHLWFDTQARQAAEWYASLIPGSRVTTVNTLRGTPSGDTEFVSFHLAGRPFMGISAGPLFKFNPSVSFHLKHATAKDVDAAWNALADGGSVLMPLGSYPFSERFGWVADKYGVSWQLMLARPNERTPSITPALMFTGRVAGLADEAMIFYTSVFKSPPPTIHARYGAGQTPDAEGTVKFATFTLGGQEFAAMDSAYPHGFAFNEAISFLVPCESQDEIDYYWTQLSADPRAEQCGWLKDKYGLSWQITPAVMGRMLADGSPEKIARVTRAFLQMKKFDLAALERAYRG